MRSTALTVWSRRLTAAQSALDEMTQQQLAVYGARSSLLRMQAERVAQLAQVGHLAAHQVGVARAGPGHPATAVAGGLGGHDVGPIGPVAVFDPYGEWGADGLAVD